jgi:hypothetical protein
VSASDPRPSSAVKAYAVLENYESTGGIVFASCNIAARREGAEEYADGDIGSVTCRRARWADAYASTGDVPASEMVAALWAFECSGCGININADLADEVDGYEGWSCSDIIGSQRSQIYCRASCETAHRAFELERSRRQDRAIERFKRVVERRFPTAVFPEKKPGQRGPHHAYASRSGDRWKIEQVSVAFNFPGMRIDAAHLRYEQRYGQRQKPYWSCCNGDREAFEKFAAETRPTKDGAHDHG